MFFVERILPDLAKISELGYWIILLAAIIESLAFAGLFFPGTAIMVVAGFFASQDVFELKTLFWFAIIGGIVGDGISFYLGKKKGNKIFKKMPFVKEQTIEKAKKFFKNYGNKSIFLARFARNFRPIIPFISGLIGTNSLLFLFWNVFGAVVWSLSYIFFGYFLGNIWQIATAWSDRVSIFLAVLVMFFIFILVSKNLMIKGGKHFFLFLKSIFQSIVKGISENNYIVDFCKKYPKFVIFLKKRFVKNSFFGFPLTLLTFAFLYLLILYIGVVESVIRNQTIVEIDVRLENLLLIFRTPTVTKVFFLITLLGKSYVVFSFSVIFAAILWLRGNRKYILPLFATIIGSSFFGYVTKLLVQRSRPTDAVYIENSFSFPSGHAILAMSFYGFLGYFLIKKTRKWKSKINIFFFILIIIFLIGFSRLYLGVHYISDVIGGYLFGALWLIIGFSIAEAIPTRRKKIIFSEKTQKWSIIILIFCETLYLSVFFYKFKIPESQFLINQKNELQIVDLENWLSQSNLSRYSETLSGAVQEPLSFIILSESDNNLINAFEKSGWYLADRVNIYNLLKILQAAMNHSQYPTAPMTPVFWNREVHNFGFQKATGDGGVRSRHHSRFWKTNYQTQDGKNIYVGTASLDVDLKWLVTHTISPDIDTERDYILEDLNNNNAIKYLEIPFVSPHIGSNFIGDPFFTDGKLYVVQL